MSSHLKGLLYAFAGVMILSPDTLLIRLADLDEWAMLVYRGLLMAVGMAIITSWFDKAPLIKQYTHIGKTGLLVAVCFSISTIAFVNAVVYTTIANTLVIVAISPLFAALYSRVFLGERLKLYTLIAILCVIAGLILVVGQGQQGGHWVGNVCALISAAAIAATFVLNRKEKDKNMVPAISISGLLGALIAAPFAHWEALSAYTVGVILAMGLVVTLAFVLITIAPRYIPAAEVSLMLPLETVGGTALAWLFLQEVPSVKTIIGGMIILITLMVHAYIGLREVRH